MFKFKFPFDFFPAAVKLLSIQTKVEFQEIKNINHYLCQCSVQAGFNYQLIDVRIETFLWISQFDNKPINV